MKIQESAREVFVISDLHLGGSYGAAEGDRGFRLNTRVPEASRFVDEVRERFFAGGVATELVINGDLVDFLAEEVEPDGGWRAFIEDESEALAVFETIVERDQLFFDSLRSAVKAGVEITVLLGNHDIELSLPRVRSRLMEVLGARESAGVTFLYDGEAYVVGDVLIEHGNRYDGFNVINFDRLRRYRSVLSRHLPADEDARFSPPSGSEMVEQVINPIKTDYPFIDLLKPENEAAIPVLVALNPGYLTDLRRIVTLYGHNKAAEGHAPVSPGRPALASEIASGATPEAAGGGSLEALMSSRMEAAALDRLSSLMDEVDAESRQRQQQIASADDWKNRFTLLKVAATSDWEKRKRVLLDALRSLQDDKSFDRTSEGGEYVTHADAMLSGGIKVVIFGHTHLPKEIERDGGRRYLNSGTWADTIRVPKAIFEEPDPSALEHLDSFLDDILSWVVFEPTFAYVTLDADGHALEARVCDYNAGVVAKL